MEHFLASPKAACALPLPISIYFVGYLATFTINSSCLSSISFRWNQRLCFYV